MTILARTLPRRRDTPELLDAPEQHPDELDRSMREIRGVNRWLGGARVALGFLASRPELAPGVASTLLDVGAGTADIPLALAGWARRRGIRLDITATDVAPEMLALARAHVRGRLGIRLALADATALPYPDAGFDYVTCNMALHHFPPEDAVRVLREMYRVSRRAVLVNDLLRCRPGYWGAKLLFGVLTRDPLTRNDGPLSVLRAYTPAEVRALAREAGLPDARVRTRPVFRLELIAEKSHA